jgi:cytidylate kinase
MLIAIDGPAGSGKGTLGSQIGHALQLPHLDTGLLYRATALDLLENNQALTDVDAAIKAALRLELKNFQIDRLRDQKVGEAASVIASSPEVRKTLVSVQRAFAKQPGGAVLDGRDIGTVICPDADIKLFLTASLEVRAARRAFDLNTRGQLSNYSEILEDIRRRDERDTLRSIAPLKAAKDAIILDTSELDIGAVFSKALSIISEWQDQ